MENKNEKMFVRIGLMTTGKCMKVTMFNYAEWYLSIRCRSYKTIEIY